MKAIVAATYGGPEVMVVRDVPTPSPGTGQVLVRVHAAGVNPADWHLMTGTPRLVRLQTGFRRPKQPIPGVDLAGVVEAVGDGVSDLAVGDEVFGGGNGSYAEAAVAKATSLARKPASVSWVQAAALPIGALTALQGLRKVGPLDGRHVLVNGAAGGVGTFAVQLAVSMGARVTGVCSTANLELVKGLGAERVVDYTVMSALSGTHRYDVILDMIGNHSLGACRRALTPGGRYVLVGEASTGDLLGPMRRLLAAKLRFLFGRRKAVALLATTKAADLAEVAALVEAGAIAPVVERTYRLEESSAAMAHLHSHHVRGKLVIEIA